MNKIKLANQFRNTFMDKTVPALQLIPTEAYVWLTLHRHTDWLTGRATLNYARMQRLTGLSQSTLIRTLKRLRELNLVRRYAVGNGRGNISTYAVSPSPNTDYADTVE